MVDAEDRDNVLALFRAADTDGNGSLSFDELRHVLLSIGVPTTDVPRIWNECDTNHDGVVDFQEFLTWTYGRDTATQESLLGTSAAAKKLFKRIRDAMIAQGVSAESLFQATDLDNNGSLSRDEVFKLLMEFDTSLTLTVLDEGFNGIDWNRNGWIDQQEFVAAIHGHLGTHSGSTADYAPTTVDVQVTVPAGSYPGQTIEIEHAGSRYHVQVPAGVVAGQIFTTPVQVAPDASASLSPALYGGSTSPRSLAATTATTPKGTRRSVSLVNTVHVQVPAGCFGGHMTQIQHNGQYYTVQIPAGLQPGDTFSTEVEEQVAQHFAPAAQAEPRKVELMVTVPAGVYAGQRISVTHEGQSYEVEVPAGCFPGSQFQTVIS